jgi:hypothetical protein
MGNSQCVTLLKDAVMKKISTILVLLMVLIFGASVCAQDENAEETGKDFLEVALFGGLSMPIGGITDWTSTGPTGTLAMGTKAGFDMGFNIGYYVTPQIVTGLDYTYSQYDIDTDLPSLDSRRHRIYGLAAYGTYYFFGESNFVPYLKAQAGIDIPKFTTSIYDGNIDSYVYRELSYDPGFAFGFGAGLFYYTYDFGGVYVEANFRNGLTDKVKGKSGNDTYVFGTNESVLDIRAGLKVFFGQE